MQRVRNRCGEAILNAGTFGLVLAGMALISDDVRRHLTNLISGDRFSELSLIAGPADRFTRTVMESFGGYQAINGQLVMFGIATVFLVGFMLKS